MFDYSGFIAVLINVIMNICILYNSNKLDVSKNIINKVFVPLTILELALTIHYILAYYYGSKVYNFNPVNSLFTFIACFIMMSLIMTKTQLLLFYSIFTIGILIYLKNSDYKYSDIYDKLFPYNFMVVMGILTIRYIFVNKTKENSILAFYGLTGLLSALIPLLVGYKYNSKETGGKYISSVSWIHNIGYIPFLPISYGYKIVLGIVFILASIINIIF